MDFSITNGKLLQFQRNFTWMLSYFTTKESMQRNGFLATQLTPTILHAKFRQERILPPRQLRPQAFSQLQAWELVPKRPLA